MSHKPKRSIRVLFVDDDDLARSAYQRMLADEFEVECAESAQEALEILESSSFHAVISDYMMPGPDGLWLMEQIRSRHPKILRILISGGNIPNLQTHLGAGLMHHFFAKPLDRDRISACLKKAGPL